jgi:undecaprenyl-diphosphatase
VDEGPRDTAASTARSTASFVLFAIVLPLVFFGVIGNSVREGHRLRWDRQVATALEGRLPRTPLSGDVAASAAAYAAVGVGALVALLLLRERRVRAALFWTLAIGGSLAFDPLLKSFFKRPGIGRSAGYSFPSGTAMLTMAVATAAVLLNRRHRLLLATGAAGLVLACAALLVHARWHYPSDVVAGWAFALAWVSALWLVLIAPSPTRQMTPVPGGRARSRGRSRPRPP